jgi:hypothetical protein
LRAADRARDIDRDVTHTRPRHVDASVASCT